MTKTLRQIIDEDHDGWEYGTDKDTGHSYIESYDELFARFKDVEGLNILELGNHHGGSLRLWNEFFTNANIIGVEVDTRKGLRYFDDIDNVTVYENTSAVSFDTIRMIEDLNIKFDIIIDDASHLPAHQSFTCQFWSRLLKEDGVLVIEDVQDIRHCETVTQWLPPNFESRVIDLRENKGRFDDILIVAGAKK